jgi:hypothetical protein
VTQSINDLRSSDPSSVAHDMSTTACIRFMARSGPAQGTHRLRREAKRTGELQRRGPVAIDDPVVGRRHVSLTGGVRPHSPRHRHVHDVGGDAPALEQVRSIT